MFTSLKISIKNKVSHWSPLKKAVDSRMETRSRTQERRMSAMEKVFGLDMLREMILDYVIHDKKKVLIQNVRVCRLVSKAWLNSTSRMLLKSKDPLFRFYLSVVNKHSQRYQDGKFLREFLELGADGQIMGEQIPPHSIKVLPIYSVQKPCQTLSHGLMTCGSSLVELYFDLTVFWRPMPLSTQVQLPRLRTFTVYLSSFCSASQSPRDFNCNADLIQSVFAASEQLKTFKFESFISPEFWTNGFDNLRFPASITELDFLGCSLNDCLLEVLAKNDLPNLKTLKFCVNKTPFKEGLITRVLERVRRTLQNLRVRDAACWTSETDGPTTFQFPLMEKLENFSIETKDLELEESHCSSLPRLLPLLNGLTLRNQPLSNVRNWIENLSVDSVKSLTVSMFSGWHRDSVGQVRNYRVNLDWNAMATISRVYPNLQELDITFCGIEMDGLMFIFSGMRNLRRLCIHVEVHDGVVNSHHWDTFLTGLRVAQLESLETVPALWDDFQVLHNSSIRNLTELHTLELQSYYSTRFPLISDASFDFAFLMMPNLKNLVFKGGFCVTPKMVKRWREEGRTIESTEF